MKVNIYDEGNVWRKDRYKFMAGLNQIAGINKYGKSKGENHYYHLIEADESNCYNVLGEPKILEAVLDRFESKAGDLKRVLSNTLASQTCCFNLFAPLDFKENRDLRNKLFTQLLGKPVKVLRQVIEYTPSERESLGDQVANVGTDADLGVFYEYDDGRKGVILLEYKYIEDEFSVCTSYKKKKHIRSVCDSCDYYKINVDDCKSKTTPNCGYVKYENWELTEKSEVFDILKIREFKHCPFRFSLNQLWRNLILAEKIARVNELDEFHFWVLYPHQNSFLWNNRGEDIYSQFRGLLTSKGKSRFRKLHIEKDIVTFLESESDNDWNKNWLTKFRVKYLTSDIK